MPSLKKKALSLFLRTGCYRQLSLNLRNDPERKKGGMPPRQTARAGLGLVGEAGFEWQDEKVSELDLVFGADNVHVNAKKRGNRPDGLPVEEVLPKLAPFQFVVEANYDAETETFKDGVGIGELHDLEGTPLGVGEAFPDILQVLPPMYARPEWEAGEDGVVAPTAQEVQPDGEVRTLPPNDGRKRLRVIDIKQSAEPGAHYFAEVVYYSVTLASWLVEHGWDDRFVVVAAPAVWPGTYESSEIVCARENARKEGRDPTPEEFARALEDDIEVAPFDVFAPRLGRFFREDLPYVLGTPWDELPWHVSYVCQGCEFLGYPWTGRDGKPMNDEKHCWPEAERTGNLSRVAGLSKGGAKLLGPVASDVGELAGVPAKDKAFDVSPTLRSKRTVFPSRARSLKEVETGIIPESGSDALMPKWPDLHIYLFLDYDLSTAITASFSLRAFWREPLPYTGPGDPTKLEPKRIRWRERDEGGKRTGFQEVFLVDRREPEREKEELLKFLRALRGILKSVREQDEADVEEGRRQEPNRPDAHRRSTYQVYLWDEAQRKQLVRVVGRHLPAILGDRDLRDLAWLFPPPELLARAEDASSRSPFTLVSDVVQNTVAVPVPHHYTLLEVAKTYRPNPEKYPAPSVHPLYREPLTDLIPGERLHEMWTHRGDWTETVNLVKETTGKKLSALANVVAKLERDLGDVLQRSAAPPIVKLSSPLKNVTPHGKLLYEYTRLNSAMDDLDSQTTRAMPPHEREARFKSAHLLRRLEGAEKSEAHAVLSGAAADTLPDADELLVYRLSPESREFNVRPPAIGYALAPRDRPGFLSSHAYPLVKDLEGNFYASGSVAEVGLTEFSVVAIDRTYGYIALKPSWNCKVPILEEAGVVDFSENVMLDPVHTDFLSRKVKKTIEGIGRPASAWHDETLLNALGMAAPEPGSETPESPASEFVWGAKRLSETLRPRDLSEARRALEDVGVSLNESQWEAWEASLTRRLALVWGPPGTGKSQTLRAVVAAAAWLADRDGRPLRLLISSVTYAAVDNVLLGADRLLEKLLPEKPYRLFRLKSDYSSLPAEFADHPDVEPMGIRTKQAPEEVLDLQASLEDPDGIVIVAGTTQQLHNLAIATKNKSKQETPARTQRRWFDLVVIDEASQVNVAESLLIVSKAAEDGAFILAGDDRQLPPIQKATPPENLDDAVGSLYGYVRHHHGVEYLPLQVNYRSSETIVEFTKRAGYDPGLHARYPDLRLAFLGGNPPTELPQDWPEDLYHTREWVRFLNPSKPAVCFVYKDEVASQANTFEADAVAAILRLLYATLDRRLSGELRGDGTEIPLAGEAHDPKSFWEEAVGVVTPHRAQMGKVVSRLQEVFPEHDPALVWRAVDTVERFQGQQRDVIVGSFGIGDPDLIRAEDEFLYNLNRFNVMASRARAKLIVLTTRSLVDHLSDDTEVLEESRLLKNFAESFCGDPRPLTLGYLENGIQTVRQGTLRSR